MTINVDVCVLKACKPETRAELLLAAYSHGELEANDVAVIAAECELPLQLGLVNCVSAAR